MSHHKPYVALLGLLIASLACGVGSAAPTEAPTPDGPATIQASTNVAGGVETAQAEARSAETATHVAQLANEASTAEAEAAQAATGTAIFAQTATPARATEVAANRKATKVAATEQAIVEATEQSEPMAKVVEQLVADGYLTRSEGVFYDIPDFDESWAQLNWYQWWGTDYQPTDFVVRADTAWQSASTKANWFNSGCGFVFREQDADNQYLMYLGLDGVVYFSRFRNGVFGDLGSKSYGKVDTPNGSAQVMLVAEEDKFSYFVNGEHVLTLQDKALAYGWLNLTLLSGTNKDFGTRCEMTNIELWELK